MAIPTSQVNKILIIKLRAIGDVLLSTVILDSLRSAFPDAQIDFLTEKASRDVVEGHHALTSTIIFDGKEQHGYALILDVRRRKYDLVIDLFGNPRSALITFFSGARYRVGYRFKWRQYCYNIIVEPRGGEVHNTEFNLDALRAIEVPINHSLPVFPLTAEAEQFAELFIGEAGLRHQTIVALNPGGGWITKRWRIHQFAQLGDKLTERYNVKVLIIWGPGERQDAEQIQKLMKSKAMVIPPTTLKQLGAILGHCSVLVTNDSGPMHIAAAVGTPVVAIFGPTSPELQGPIGSPSEIVQHQRLLCLGCNYTQCPIGNPCMEELTVEEVFDGFTRLAERVTIVRGQEQTA
ncbi:MAG: lipopolysaccharide heptosyltransferase II [Ignavibacteria bacterium]|nr:lipopolysaccharide heptosyltransferase II [Ignavibacteria bacterium]